MATCSNCGGQAPADARFCPRCAAPMPAVPEAAEAQRPRWERVLFGLVLLLLLAIGVLAVLVVVFGVFVDSASA